MALFDVKVVMNTVYPVLSWTTLNHHFENVMQGKLIVHSFPHYALFASYANTLLQTLPSHRP